MFISQTTDFHFANYRFPFRKLQILISQTTDSHFANYRFSFRKLQISISQTTDFHFVSSHFVSQTTVSHLGQDSPIQTSCSVNKSNKSPRMLTCERVINYQIFFKRFPFLQNKFVNLHRLIMTLNNFESQSKSLLDLI